MTPDGKKALSEMGAFFVCEDGVDQTLGFLTMKTLRAFAVFLVLGCSLRAEDVIAKKPITRAEFAAAFQHIQKGQAEKEVISLLGKPDDIHTAIDPSGIHSTDTRDIWCYGTEGHLTFPVLGCIYFDTSGKVQYAYGIAGDPMLEKSLGDAEINRIVRMLSRVSGISSHYNPQTVVMAANTLAPLGKEKACRLIREYDRVAASMDTWWRLDAFDEYNIQCLTRILFDAPEAKAPVINTAWLEILCDGYLRPPMLGGSNPRPPEDLKITPRFPVYLINDIPILITTGYILAGREEFASEYLDRNEKQGVWHGTLFVPPDNPFPAYSDFKALKGWDGFKDESLQERILTQILAMVQTVYRPAKEDVDFKTATAEFEKCKAKWDQQKCMYTFANGETLPEIMTPIYYRKLFKPKLKDETVDIALKREDELKVALKIESNFSGQFFVHLYRFEIGKRIEMPAERGGSRGFDLKECDPVQMIIEKNGEFIESEVLIP